MPQESLLPAGLSAAVPQHGDQFGSWPWLPQQHKFFVVPSGPSEPSAAAAGVKRNRAPLLSPAGWKGTHRRGHILLHALHQRVGQVRRASALPGASGGLGRGRGSAGSSPSRGGAPCLPHAGVFHGGSGRAVSVPSFSNTPQGWM